MAENISNSHMQNTGLLQEAMNRYSANINDLNAALNCGEVLGQNSQIPSMDWASDKDSSNPSENICNTRFLDLDSSHTEKFKLCSLDLLFLHPKQLRCDPNKELIEMSDSLSMNTAFLEDSNLLESNVTTITRKKVTICQTPVTFYVEKWDHQAYPKPDLTGEERQQICEELNKFKAMMDIHPHSHKYTEFFMPGKGKNLKEGKKRQITEMKNRLRQELAELEEEMLVQQQLNLQDASNFDN